jgi:hypothetical protein
LPLEKTDLQGVFVQEFCHFLNHDVFFTNVEMVAPGKNHAHLWFRDFCQEFPELCLRANKVRIAYD